MAGSRPKNCIGKVIRPHARAPSPRTAGSRPKNCTFRRYPLRCRTFFNLDVGDELLEIVRRAVRLRAYADLNGEMSERGGVHWRVFGCSFYLTSSVLNTSGHDRRSQRSLPTASWKFCWLRPRSPRNSMSARVEHAARQELVTYSCCGQSHLTFAPGCVRSTRHGCCSIDRCQAGLHCYARQVSLFSGFHDISSLFL